VALTTSRLLACASDGEAVAALIGVTEAPGALEDDGGSAPAVARLAVALGLASEEAWPAEPEERVRVLLAALHTAGAHPDAPARIPRITAWSLALNAEPDLPVPLSPEELRAFGRLAGVGSDPSRAELDPGEGWPPRLSPEEVTVLPDEDAVRHLLRRAAWAVARLDLAEARASAPARPGEGS
jgi:hypothetical protein